jgi:hypothetical protein
LLVFVLSDSVFCFEFVVFHGLGVVEVDIFGVEHMGAEIQHCAFIDFGCFILGGVDLRVVLHKIADSLNKLAVLFLRFEVLLFREVRETDKQVHEH